MVGDFLSMVFVAVALSIVLFDGHWVQTWVIALPNAALGLAVYSVAWVAALHAHGMYRMRANWSTTTDVIQILHALAWLALGTLAVLFVLRLPDVSRSFLIVLFASQFLVVVASRGVARWLLGIARRDGRNARHLLVLGTGQIGQQFAAKLESRPELGLRVMGFLGESGESLPARWPYLGTIDDLPEVIHDRVVDEVAVCILPGEWQVVEAVAKLCEAEGKIARMPVPMPSLSFATGHVEDLEGTPVLSLVTGPTAIVSLGVKRATDLVVSVAVITILSPLIVGIAAMKLIADGRPIFFRQERVGLHGRRFRVAKFRTMGPDAHSRVGELASLNEIRGHAFKVTKDPRVTKVGAWLRRSSLDELPQLWNVLRGEMSLVGPRPPLPEEVAAYDAWHRRRLSMKPGITGLWQVEGRREPDFDRWVEKDLEYIDRWTPWLDIKIMIRTIPAMLRAEGR
jgi:exopolysaccharide biosynthesis polyprenyl glycosylphosphotransferase